MNGNLCGLSTGEALSRWCAAVIGNNALSDFATAPQWVQDGQPDWVDKVDPTDQDADSTGCGMAFLSWLISQGYGLEKIAPAMVNAGDSGTLAQLYANLTSDAATNAWTNFQSGDPGLARRRNQRRSLQRVGAAYADGASCSPDRGTGGQGVRSHDCRCQCRPAARTDHGQRPRRHARGFPAPDRDGLLAQIEALDPTRQGAKTTQDRINEKRRRLFICRRHSLRANVLVA